MRLRPGGVLHHDGPVRFQQWTITGDRHVANSACVLNACAYVAARRGIGGHAGTRIAI
jgi:hypothetical protein